MQAWSQNTEDNELSGFCRQSGKLLCQAKRFRKFEPDRPDGYVFWREGLGAKKGQADGHSRREHFSVDFHSKFSITYYLTNAVSLVGITLER